MKSFRNKKSNKNAQNQRKLSIQTEDIVINLSTGDVKKVKIEQMKIEK